MHDPTLSLQPRTTVPQRVLIGTPTFDGKVDSRYLVSLVATLREALPRYLIDVKFICGDTFLGRARDHLVQIAVEQRADILLWIDADSYWEPSDVLTLLDSPHDYIGALQRLKTAKPIAPIRLLPNETADASGVLKVRGVGFGMTKMTSACFNTLHAVSIPYTSQGRPLHRIFETPVVNGQLVGEDFAACDLWASLGHPVYVDTTVKIGHVGYMTTYDFDGLDDPDSLHPDLVSGLEPEGNNV